MKKVMITGATGLVGTHLVAELLEQRRADDSPEEYDITAVAHSEESWKKLDWLLLKRGVAGRPFRRVVASLEYIEDCRRLVGELKPDIVFNCAARVVVGKAREGEKLVTRNVEITHNMVTAALELVSSPGEGPLFVHVSSIATLGGAAGPSGCVDESAVMENLAGASAYARSKFLSENEVWRAAAHGLRVVVVNPAVIVGAMSPQSGFWLNELFKAVRRGGNRFWIGGETAFVAADDVARAMILLAETPQTWGKRYILSAENITYRRFLNRIARAEGLPEPRIKVPRWVLRLAAPFAPSLGAVVTPHQRYDGSEIMRAVPLRYTSLSDTLSQIAAMTGNSEPK